MPDLIVIEQLLAYLVSEGIAQRLSATPIGALPAVCLAPRDGAPLPRDLTLVDNAWTGEVTITLVDSLTLGRDGLQPYVENCFVDVIVRSPQPTPGKLVQRRIRELIAPTNEPGGRHQWMMGALLVERSFEWRGDQPLPRSQALAAGDDKGTYDRVASYCFAARRKVLAGLPLL